MFTTTTLSRVTHMSFFQARVDGEKWVEKQTQTHTRTLPRSRKFWIHILTSFSIQQLWLFKNLFKKVLVQNHFFFNCFKTKQMHKTEFDFRKAWKLISLGAFGGWKMLKYANKKCEEHFFFLSRGSFFPSFYCITTVYHL